MPTDFGRVESYVGRVKEEMEAFGARLKSSKDKRKPRHRPIGEGLAAWWTA